MLFLWIPLFIISYSLIYWSADKFIDNLKDLSSLLKASPFIIGLLILGIDPEETIASLMAAINGLPYIALGPVIGNSIISLTLCFALPAIFYTVKLEKIPNFYPILIIISVAIILSGVFYPYNMLITGTVNLLIFGIYLAKNLHRFKKTKRTDIIIEDEEERDEDNEDEGSKINTILLTILFFILIFIGGHFLIVSTKEILSLTTIDQSFFGFIIIAFFTDVEEILLLIKAIQKGETSIGVGGMIGKIIWNVGFTYGISGLILISAEYNMAVILNSIILLLVSIYFLYLIKIRKITKINGMILSLIFVSFIVVNFLLNFSVI
jgi:cation:H+ antiporter